MACVAITVNLIFPEHAFTRACSRAPHNLRVGGGVCHCPTPLTVHVSRPLPTHPLSPTTPNALASRPRRRDRARRSLSRSSSRWSQRSGGEWYAVAHAWWPQHAIAQRAFQSFSHTRVAVICCCNTASVVTNDVCVCVCVCVCGHV
jgi:hypothetical protein